MQFTNYKDFLKFYISKSNDSKSYNDVEIKIPEIKAIANLRKKYTKFPIEINYIGNNERFDLIDFESFRKILKSNESYFQGKKLYISGVTK